MRMVLMVSVVPSTTTTVVLMGVWQTPATFSGGGASPTRFRLYG